MSRRHQDTMLSTIDSENETLKTVECPQLNAWKNQQLHLKDNVNIRPNVELTTLTIEDLGLTSLHHQFDEMHCTKIQRLQTFRSGSKFSQQAGLLADKGYFEDGISCFLFLVMKYMNTSIEQG